MNEFTPLNERVWPAENVLAMACAIFRTKGYTSVSSVTSSDPDSDERWNSKEHLSYQMVPDLTKDYKVLIKVTQEDVDTASAIIQYYRRLTFGVIADNLNDYMQRVFASTQKPEVYFKDFGVLASVPNVYFKEMEKKRIVTESKNAKQEHIGVIGEPILLNIRYINTRYIQKLNCYAHDAVTDDGHLVNFLNKSALGKTGETQTIRARVKAHGVNYTTKSIETQLNYVKPIDNELIWQ
jgi:inhibitor of KinA sporulation pathway (predicted exonuclease)